MVSDQDRDPGLGGALHPGQAGDAVVHRDDEVRGQGQGRLHHCRAQAIAKGEAAWHQGGDPCRPQGLEATHRQRAAGGPVGVVIPHDQDVPATPDVQRQELRGRRNALEGREGVHTGKGQSLTRVRPTGAIEMPEETSGVRRKRA